MTNHLDDREEPLDARLSDLYAKEAQAPLPPGCEERVLAGVLARLAQGPSPAAPGPDPSAAPELAAGPAIAVSGLSSAKVLAIALLSAIFGAFLGVAIDRQWGRASQSGEPGPVATELVDSEPAMSPADAGPTDATVARVAPEAPEPNVPPQKSIVRPEPEGEPLPLEEREAHLINRARAALRRGLLDESLLALMQHERRFPDGRLAEERDVLAIETYVAKGELAIAARRIKRYRERYPEGFHTERVDRLEGELP